MFVFNFGLFEPSPFIETVKKSDGFMETWLFKSSASPSESNPGPKFALVAGVFIINSISFYSAGMMYSGSQFVEKSVLSKFFGRVNGTIFSLSNF